MLIYVEAFADDKSDERVCNGPRGLVPRACIQIHHVIYLKTRSWHQSARSIFVFQSWSFQGSNNAKQFWPQPKNISIPKTTR